MQVIFLGQRQLRWGMVFFIINILCTGIFVNWDRLSRHFCGVKPDVWLEGYLIEGMLPNEVARFVKNLAAKIDRAPVNAGYFQETGAVVAAQQGKTVDVAANVHRVYRAKPGSRIHLIVNAVQPEITNDFFKAIYRGNPEQPRVALAINVAWGEEYLPGMLQILAAEKVKATFFMVGNWVKMFPDLVKEIHAQGHEIANHGSFHGHPAQMTRDEIKKLIRENEVLINGVCGDKPTKYFAPPYGEVNNTIISSAAELGYRTIMWTVDSVDWKNPTPEVMNQRIMGKIEPGAIVLFHPTAVTRTSLRGLIRAWRQKGLEPGPVSSVLK